jgi:NAD(P)-dependent dehydrogenase (short-subunit alcohol dehydrogenase family)/acyl carrier protein
VEDPVRERILALVVEKTGYPRDMLDLDLDLEADLGVDTVKQAELFAAIRESYDIPRDPNLKLRDFPTLAHVIRFVYDRRPDLSAVGVPVAVAGEDPVKERILALVVEKTGYPREMLDLDLDLEADLGVDTVKQAELFASVRAAFDIPRDPNLKLRDFPTLAHVVKFALDALERRTPKVEETPPVENVSAARAASPRDAIPRRVPVPELRPALDLSKPTGVTLGAGSRVVLMPDRGGAGEALAGRLRALGVEVLRIDGAQDAAALTPQLKQWADAGPIAGVYWLAALDDEGDWRRMELGDAKEALRIRVKLLYATVRAMYGQTPFLVAATRLGGQHGYDEARAFAPFGGAATGFAKTYKRERPEALVKAVDFEPDRDAGEIAATLIEETLRDPGAVEIGYQSDLRWTVGLREQPFDAVQKPGLTLGRDTVFVITGAAGSIVSAITADLAAASGGVFYLLDRVPAPDASNSDLARFVSDKDGLKRDLFARIQARGERATPALVERELAQLERLAAANAAMEAIRAAGGSAHYFSVDLTDSEAVNAVIGKVREQSGRIDVLLHAAGIERSHFLPDKDPREFDLVFDVKTDGWFDLLRAAGDMPVGVTVAFSSVAGRFGNAGQADYSAANDLLCKIASRFRTVRPGTRAIAIDWTAWGGIGMATRGSIPKMMELAGIDMLPPEVGVPWIRRELECGGEGEVVVARRLGILTKDWDSTGGLDPVAAARRGHGVMVGEIAGVTFADGLVIETRLDPNVQPFLYDHQIEGTPVLPGVMGIEAFAEAATWMLPGWCVEAIENVEFLAPFKFYRKQPRALILQLRFQAESGGVVADCQLVGRRELAVNAETQTTVHFSARLRLTRQAAEPARGDSPGEPNGARVDAADIYRVYFHGPAYQVLQHAWRAGHRIVGRMAAHLPSNHHPPEWKSAAFPRGIELCFQTAGLWEMGEQGRMGLPQHIDRVQVWRTPAGDAEDLFAVVKLHSGNGNFDAEVVDTAGNRYVELTGYRTAALPGNVDVEPLKALAAMAW